jgi:hypothetical protein
MLTSQLCQLMIGMIWMVGVLGQWKDLEGEKLTDLSACSKLNFSQEYLLLLKSSSVEQ